MVKSLEEKFCEELGCREREIKKSAEVRSPNGALQMKGKWKDNAVADSTFFQPTTIF